MLIRIEDIKENGLNLEVVERAGDFPVLAEMAGNGEVEFPAPVHAVVRAIRVRELIEVEGRVETSVRLSCSRCLKGFTAPLVVPFAVAFAREAPEVTDETGEEIELSAEEMGLIPFEGEEIDLRPVLQEQIVMALPVRSLCREACKGLCPQCGADLNETDCGCERPVFAPKFSALKDFKAARKDREEENKEQ